MRTVIFCFCFSLLLVTSLYSQSIIRRSGKYIVFKESDGYPQKMNIKLEVFRILSTSQEQVIGVIETLKAKDGMVAAVIVSETPGFTISAGDRLRLPVLTSELNPDEESILNQLFGSSEVWHQVTKAIPGFVLVDADQTSHIKIGDTYTLKRENAAGLDLVIGKVEVLTFRNGQCACKVIEQTLGERVSVGDFLVIDTKSTQMATSQPMQFSAHQSKNVLGVGSICLGLAATVAGAYFYNQAVQTYSDYEAATTSASAIRLYDETMQHYQRSKIGLGVGGGMVAFGIVYSLIRGSSPSARPAKYGIAPVKAPNTIGLGFQIALN